MTSPLYLPLSLPLSLSLHLPPSLSLPLSSSVPPVFRAGWTMLISAYWHGLHAGYYLSFLTIPLCIAAETSMEASVRSRLGPRGQSAFDWVHWFLKMRAYDYMCMGFVLLKAGDTVSYWSSIYFSMHLIAVACILFGRLFKGGRRERKGASEGEKAEEERKSEGEKAEEERKSEGEKAEEERKIEGEKAEEERKSEEQEVVREKTE